MSRPSWQGWRGPLVLAAASACAAILASSCRSATTVAPPTVPEPAAPSRPPAARVGLPEPDIARLAPAPNLRIGVVLDARRASVGTDSGVVVFGQAADGSWSGRRVEVQRATFVPAATGQPPRAAPRFRVQVGSFADERGAREVAARAEQTARLPAVVGRFSGTERYQVRIGEFASRDEAQAKAGELHRAGFPGSFVAEDARPAPTGRVRLLETGDEFSRATLLPAGSQFLSLDQARLPRRLRAAFQRRAGLRPHQRRGPGGLPEGCRPERAVPVGLSPDRGPEGPGGGRAHLRAAKPRAVRRPGIRPLRHGDLPGLPRAVHREPAVEPRRGRDAGTGGHVSRRADQRPLHVHLRRAHRGRRATCSTKVHPTSPEWPAPRSETPSPRYARQWAEGARGRRRPHARCVASGVARDPRRGCLRAILLKGCRPTRRSGPGPSTSRSRSSARDAAPPVAASLARRGTLLPVPRGLFVLGRAGDPPHLPGDPAYLLAVEDREALLPGGRRAAGGGTPRRRGHREPLPDNTLRPGVARPAGRSWCCWPGPGRTAGPPDLVSATFQGMGGDGLELLRGDERSDDARDPAVRLFRNLDGVSAAASEMSLAVGDDVRYVARDGRIDIPRSRARTRKGIAADRDSRYYRWEVRLTPEAVAEAVARYGKVGPVRDLEATRDRGLRSSRRAHRAGQRRRPALEGPARPVGTRPAREPLRDRARARFPGRCRALSSSPGKGWGHGVGLCQVGAFGMAKAGATFEQILKHYYSGIALDAHDLSPFLNRTGRPARMRTFPSERWRPLSRSESTVRVPRGLRGQLSQLPFPRSSSISGVAADRRALPRLRRSAQGALREGRARGLRARATCRTTAWARS